MNELDSMSSERLKQECALRLFVAELNNPTIHHDSKISEVAIRSWYAATEFVQREIDFVKTSHPTPTPRSE